MSDVIVNHEEALEIAYLIRGKSNIGRCYIELRNLLSKIAKSGLLCDTGCCGDDCVCDEIRKLAKEEKPNGENND